MIPYGKQDIVQSDIDAVIKTLSSDFLTQGEMVPLFEEEVCNYTGVKYSIAVNSATSALHLACLSLGLEKDDWLWTSPNTFVASANCGLYCGAKVDFVDIDQKTYNLSTELLEEKLIQAEKDGKLPKIIIPVHFAGQSCEMESIFKLSQKYGFKIIEDASHAIGGKYQNHPIGSGKYSDIIIFSFHPVKIITTGEGGMAVTNSKKLADKMLLLRSHGITRNLELINKKTDEQWYYQQIDLGFNYRMTDIQAALGISQIQRLDEYIFKRSKIIKKYNQELKDYPLVLPYQHQDTSSAYHLYVIKISKYSPLTRRQLFDKLIDKNIGANVHYIPIHTQPYYQRMGFKQGDFPNAEDYYQHSISLPVFPTLTDDEQNYIIDTLKESLAQ